MTDKACALVLRVVKAPPATNPIRSVVPVLDAAQPQSRDGPPYLSFRDSRTYAREIAIKARITAIYLWTNANPILTQTLRCSAVDFLIGP